MRHGSTHQLIYRLNFRVTQETLLFQHGGWRNIASHSLDGQVLKTQVPAGRADPSTGRGGAGRGTVRFRGSGPPRSGPACRYPSHPTLNFTACSQGAMCIYGCFHQYLMHISAQSLGHEWHTAFFILQQRGDHVCCMLIYSMIIWDGIFLRL